MGNSIHRNYYMNITMNPYIFRISTEIDLDSKLQKFNENEKNKA